MGELNREQRRVGVDEAFASLRLDGHVITDAARSDADDYIEGRRSLMTSSRTSSSDTLVGPLRTRGMPGEYSRR